MVTAVPGIARRRTSCSTMSVSPIIVSSQNAWSLQDVRFTDAECSNYILRFCKKYFGGMNQEDALCLEQYVRNMTKGHPGLVAFFMGSIRNQFNQQLKYPKDRERLSWNKIFEYLKSYRFWATVMNVSVFLFRLQGCIMSKVVVI